MLLLENEKGKQKTNVLPLPNYAIKKNTPNIYTQDNRNLAFSSYWPNLETPKIEKNFKLSKKLKNKKYDPRQFELEITPSARRCIKALLSPIAVVSYILQESSIAFNKILTATISFLVFNLLNLFTSVCFGSYEVKLPMMSICLVGSIIGARRLIRSIKKIITSIPCGIYTCSKNISCDKCSILDFICGIDKSKKNLLPRLAKKFSL
ncbi:MAG: hypothetical protein J6Y29_02005 [Clostridiales bacterium]|nr:hypothetical protein [Clostridiales bacterium]